MNATSSHVLRLAVLLSPADNGEEGPDAYYARGFMEDLVTDLSRFPSIGIISPRSSLASRLRELDDRQVAMDLQSDLLLKTSIRKRPGKIRINAQLLDPQRGVILWAERYDAPEDEVFALQDSIVEKVVAALALQIDAATLDAARRKPVTELAAYDCWLRGFEKLREGRVEADEEARELFERALEIDPHYARAYVGLSLSHFNEWSCQNWDLSEVSECRAYQYAQHALQLDRRDHVAHLVAGRVHLFRREFERAVKHLDLAYELNPNDADQLVQIASCQAFLGNHDRAIELFDRAIVLNPFCDPWYYAYGGFIRILRGDYEDGISLALRAPLTSVWIDLAGWIGAAHAALGNTEEAGIYGAIFLETFQEKILKGRPPRRGEALEWLLEVNPLQRGEDRAFFRERLIQAGLSGAPKAKEVPTVPSGTIDRSPRGEVFRAGNGIRHIEFEGERRQVPEVKGFQDLARLLERPGEEIHCTDLMGIVSEDGAGPEVMDAQARADCAAQIRELQAELDEAEERNDLARAERIREELDPLLDHLAKAVGIGGRSRKLAAPAERARSAVTWRIRSAIGKIEAVHPALGRHLANSVRTGTFCTYAPEGPRSWLL